MANSSFIKGTIETPVPTDKGGTGLSSLGTANQVLRTNSGATAIEWADAETGSSFGGDGSDGTLSVTSGTTNLDASSANVLVKNYSSISISNGATLGLSNKASNGTLLILRSSGDVTIEGTIELTSMGASTDTNGYGIEDATADHDGGVGGNSSGDNPGAAGSSGAILGLLDNYITPDSGRLYKRYIALACGSGGGKGGNSINGTGGDGGAGGGGLIIECAGALDFDSGGVININGGDGANGGSGINGGAGGGGGGSAGMALILYNTLTDNSGTINAKGGAGGNGGDSPSGSGANYASGGGGAGAGSYTSAGKAGIIGVIHGTNGNNGINGTSSEGAGGASGSGSSSVDTGYTGGTGGTQGGSSDSNHYVVAKNIWL